MAETTTRAKELLGELIAFDTTSRNSNLEIIDFLERELEAAGARVRRVPRDDGEKANLYAVIGPDAPGGVALSGHTDVVPVDGQDWSSDPFAMDERDGRLYGRGTCDMKGFIACAVAMAPRFAEADLKRPVVYALSYDEEIGCLGAPAMIDAIAADGPPLDAVVVGEPTEMKVVSAHKGLHSLRVELRGKEGHSSLPELGACAVTHMVPLMQMMLDEAEAMRRAAPADSPFHPPHGTLTIGAVEGGGAHNILAGRASFTSLMRPAPWDDTEDFEERLRAKAAEVEAVMRRGAPDAEVIVERLTRVPAFMKHEDSAAESLARALTGDNAVRAVSYGTEAGQFQERGFATIICGPGSIEQAHQPDEFVAVDQLASCSAFLEKLAARLAA